MEKLKAAAMLRIAKQKNSNRAQLLVIVSVAARRNEEANERTSEEQAAVSLLKSVSQPASQDPYVENDSGSSSKGKEIDRNEEDEEDERGKNRKEGRKSKVIAYNGFERKLDTV